MMPNPSNDAGPVLDREQTLALLEPLTDLVVQAGMAILAIDRGAMTTQGKHDGSPVSDADLAADRVIAAGLSDLAAEIPTVSEERAPRGARPRRNCFFLIDPLDGTREFIDGRDEFTVNVALVSQGQPVLGIVGAPALGLVWRGVVGHSAERLLFAKNWQVRSTTPLRTRRLPPPGEPWIVAVSRSHGDPYTERFIAERPGATRRALGSAIKFCRVAEGGADIYPRLSPTSEWDVAAGHAVLTAAGGQVTDTQGAPLRFGAAENFLVPDFIAWGDPDASANPRSR